MPSIIVKKYEHLNTALPHWDTPRGKLIRTKAQYENELKKNGMVSLEKGEAIAQSVRSRREADKYSPSVRSLELMREIKSTADRKGNVRLSDRQIDAMKAGGMRFGEKLRAVACRTEGGFR